MSFAACFNTPVDDVRDISAEIEESISASLTRTDFSEALISPFQRALDRQSLYLDLAEDTEWMVSAFIHRSKVLKDSLPFEEREFFDFSPSNRLVSDFRRTHRRSIGSPLTFWIPGIAISENECSHLLMSALQGSLSGIAAIFSQQDFRGEDEVRISETWHDLLIGGIMTRLGRGTETDKRNIAESIVEELTEALRSSRLEFDGGSLYAVNSALIMRRSPPVSLSEILQSRNRWEIRNVSL
jgi:hypothetical protein